MFIMSKRVFYSYYLLYFLSLTAAGFIFIIAQIAFSLPAKAQDDNQAIQGSVLLGPVTVITGEWAPYSTEFDERYGYVTELVTQTLRGMNKTPTYAFFPFFAGYEKTRAGEAFATFPYFYTEERAADFYYSDPLAQVEYVVFVHNDDLDKFQSVEKVEDLKPFVLGKVSGYAYGALDPFITSEGPDAASEIQAFRMLLDKKVDYVAASRAVGQKLIERYFFEDLHKFHVLQIQDDESELKKDLTWPIDIHVLFPKVRSTALRDRDDFNASLKKVLATGYSQILNRFNSADVKARRIVRLSDPGSFALVTAKANLQSRESFIIPRGSKAVVVTWSKNFETQEITTVHEQMSRYTRVKLLNGPLRGRLVWVRNMFIELPEE